MQRRRTERERQADVLLESYQNLNGFLCAYIDHSLPSHQYFIRNRYFLEKIFDYEFQVGMGPALTGLTDSLFVIGKRPCPAALPRRTLSLLTDKDKTFTKTLFYGEESTLFIWNTITFLFIDYVSKNYILAAIITYLLNLVSPARSNAPCSAPVSM